MAQVGMKHIGTHLGYEIYWYPETGGVYVGLDRAGDASSEGEALQVAKAFIRHWVQKS